MDELRDLEPMLSSAELPVPPFWSCLAVGVLGGLPEAGGAGDGEGATTGSLLLLLAVGSSLPSASTDWETWRNYIQWNLVQIRPIRETGCPSGPIRDRLPIWILDQNAGCNCSRWFRPEGK